MPSFVSFLSPVSLFYFFFFSKTDVTQSCGPLYLCRGKRRPGGAANIHYAVSKALFGNNREGWHHKLRPARLLAS